MSRSHISKRIRERVRRDARNRCGYCLMTDELFWGVLEIDHIVPVAAGGTSDESNLWLACSLCNSFKGDRKSFLDQVTLQIVPLFNPRKQVWNEHFNWSHGGAILVGRTPTGRATINALRMNSPKVVQIRKRWITVGWHPPKDSLDSH